MVQSNIMTTTSWTRLGIETSRNIQCSFPIHTISAIDARIKWTTVRQVVCIQMWLRHIIHLWHEHCIHAYVPLWDQFGSSNFRCKVRSTSDKRLKYWMYMYEHHASIIKHNYVPDTKVHLLTSRKYDPFKLIVNPSLSETYARNACDHKVNIVRIFIGNMRYPTVHTYFFWNPNHSPVAKTTSTLRSQNSLASLHL